MSSRDRRTLRLLHLLAVLNDRVSLPQVHLRAIILASRFLLIVVSRTLLLVAAMLVILGHLDTFPDTIGKVAEPLGVTVFKDVVDLFELQTFGLGVAKVDDWYKGSVQNREDDIEVPSHCM